MQPITGVCRLLVPEDVMIAKQASLLCDELLTHVRRPDGADEGEVDFYFTTFQALKRHGIASSVSLELDLDEIDTEVTTAWREFAPAVPEAHKLEAINDLLTRAYAARLSTAGYLDTVPIVSYPFAMSPDRTRRVEALRVVLKQLPMPDGRTPWEAIADWRADNDTRMRYRRLRKWISDCARTQLSASEIEEQLATLADDYATFAASRHKRLSRSRCEVIVATIAEIAEDIAAFRWSGAVNSLFSLYREETTLLEAELTAPGREVAYVVNARQQFRQ